MRVWTGYPRAWGPGPGRGTALAVGVFDGVHRGHRSILAGLSKWARHLGDLDQVVVTFDVHPRSFFDPVGGPRLLTTVTRRLELLESMGIDQVGLLPFASVRHLSPGEFVRRVVTESFNARAVVVGRGFLYGAERAGDVSTLQEAGSVHGFAVEARELLEGRGGPISSSSIRRRIAEGEVAVAADLLGRPHGLHGTVIRSEGDSSAGLLELVMEVDRAMAVPGRGVYAVRVVIDGERRPALCNIPAGSLEADGNHRVEVQVLDAGPEPGAREMVVLFEERLRAVAPSGRVTEMDIAEARRILT